MSRQTKLYIQKTTILLAVYLVFRFLLPLILPFFLAWMTVCFLIFLQKKIHIKLIPLSICYLILFILITGTAGLCTCWLLYEPCQELFPLCRNYWMQFSDYLSWMPELLTGRLADTMPSVLACLFGVFLYFISVLLFARDWERFHRMLGHLPFFAPVHRAGKRITQSLKGWVRAQFKIMFVICVQCAVGYYFLQIPAFLFWAVVTGIVDALPVFGTGTIFLPWLLVTALQGNYTFAIWLGLLYLVTWLTRELLEPKLLGDGLGLLPVCFLMSVIVGLHLFGPVGLFSGPFGVLLVKELWVELETSAPPENS